MDHSFTRWEEHLNAVVTECSGLLGPVSVVGDVDSTQDEARRRDARPGAIIVATRQTAGRGRRSRPWADTGHEGTAMSFVFSADHSRRLAIVSAVATTMAIKSLDEGVDVGIKWPNDILIASRKVAGILTEVRDNLAIVGVGINVSQTEWPGTLGGRAISLRQAGIVVDRLNVMDALIRSTAEVLQFNDSALSASFAEHDVLTGTSVRIRHRNEELMGRMTAIDPLRSITIETPQGERVFSVDHTTILAADAVYQ